MEVEEGRRLVSRVDELKTPLIEIKRYLLTSNLFSVCDANCKHCLINPQECEFLKFAIQELIDQGIIIVEHLSISEDVATLEIPYDQVQPLQIPYDMSPMTICDNPFVPLLISVHRSFPFKETKVVP